MIQATDFERLQARAQRLGWALQPSCRLGFLLEQPPRKIFCGDDHTLTKTLIQLARDKRTATRSNPDHQNY